MNILSVFFNTILYQPLLNILILLYTYFPGHDFGIAIIILTLLIKIILSPTSLKAVRSQRILAELQPKIKEIQQKHKNDKAKQSQAMMEIYKKEKINPLSGCFPLLIQLPILIAMYQVFLRGLTPEALGEALYKFVPYPSSINLMFLGIIDLGQPNIFLALLAGILQFFQSKLSVSSTKIKKEQGKTSKKDFSSMMQNQMLYFFPVLTVFIVWKFGSIIGLYWIVSALFSIGEQYIIRKQKVNPVKKPT